MTLEVLSFGESLSLCRSAAVLVLDRFRWLARHTDRGDTKLGQLFVDLAGDMEGNLAEIRILESEDLRTGVLQEQPGQEVARGFLPSLTKSVGGGCVDRESAFYQAECLLEDLARFYGALVRQTRDDPSREFLRRSEGTVNARLQFLHRVVL